MQRTRFSRLVDEALNSIPDALWERLDNVEVIVRLRPTREELDDAGIEPGHTLLGLYHGHALTHRGDSYNMALPDQIYIYQEPIEQICRSDEEVVEQVRTTVLHEIAHHFGIDDERLHELGLA